MSLNAFLCRCLSDCVNGNPLAPGPLACSSLAPAKDVPGLMVPCRLERFHEGTCEPIDVPPKRGERG